MGRANATACYRELGAELRKHREAAGRTAVQIAHETGWDRTKISRIESGAVNATTVDVIFYLAACGIHNKHDMADLLHLCRLAASSQGYWLSSHGDWLQDSLTSLIYHESTADRTISYEPFSVPGLLQTPAYARTKIAQRIVHSSRSVDEAVQIRMDRRAMLHRPGAADFVFFVHEQALRNQIGSTAVMHEQLLHMVLMAALRNVIFRIVPAECVQSKFGGPFQLFEHHEHSPLLYLDGVLTGMFIEDSDYVGDYYRHMVPELKAVALNAGESREYAANLADEYDRGSPPDVHLEEEQL